MPDAEDLGDADLTKAGGLAEATLTETEVSREEEA